MQIIFQQPGIVVSHFFEVGDQPAFINRVAMKAARELILDAAASHLFQRALRHRQQGFSPVC